MKTSARNQFEGRITHVATGAVNDEIELSIAGGLTLVAIVTRRSSEALGLAAGKQAVALVKASSVILVTDAEGMRFSARNCLTGTVARVTPGAVNAEVELDVAGGAKVVAIVTQASCDALALAPGKAATALIKASAVVIGARA